MISDEAFFSGRSLRPSQPFGTLARATPAHIAPRASPRPPRRSRRSPRCRTPTPTPSPTGCSSCSVGTVACSGAATASTIRSGATVVSSRSPPRGPPTPATRTKPPPPRLSTSSFAIVSSRTALSRTAPRFGSARTPSDAPRCALEELAGAIFQLHTRDCDDYDPETSGAEWWVQSRPGLSCHWDKDEELRVAAGLFVHPQVSTVTYLTAGAAQAPTLVFEGMTVPSLARQGHDNPADLPAAPECTAVCASYPEVGKHVAFDGRLLHGALREMAEPDGERRTARARALGSRFSSTFGSTTDRRACDPSPMGSSRRSGARLPCPRRRARGPSAVAQVEATGADVEGWAELGGRFFGWSGGRLETRGAVTSRDAPRRKRRRGRRGARDVTRPERRARDRERSPGRARE